MAEKWQRVAFNLSPSLGPFLIYHTAPALGFTEILNDDYVRGRHKVKVYHLLKKTRVRYVEHLENRQEDT